jgi:hypothetical protein
MLQEISQRDVVCVSPVLMLVKNSVWFRVSRPHRTSEGGSEMPPMELPCRTLRLPHPGLRKYDSAIDITLDECSSCSSWLHLSRVFVSNMSTSSQSKAELGWPRHCFARRGMANS